MNIPSKVKLKLVVTGVVSTITYPLLIRGAISFFHIKLGGLVNIIHHLGGEKAVADSIYVIASIYDNLTNLWQSKCLFWFLWIATVATCLCISLLIEAKKDRGQPRMALT